MDTTEYERLARRAVNVETRLQMTPLEIQALGEGLLQAREHLTSEPAGPDEHGQTPEAYEELGRSFFEEYNRVQNDPAMEGYICADSPVEIIPHLLNAVGDLKAELALSVETSRQLQSAIDVDTKALVALVEERREPEPAASMTAATICAANRSADPPQDCDWPFCGCDAHANKVIEAIGNVRDQRQARMMTWGAAAFGLAETNSVEQRGYRHMEEAIEAGQAAGCARDKTHKLVDHIFDRDAGELGQEIGGSGITLLMLAAAAGLNADAEEDREMRRVLSKPIEHFTARNKAKNDAGFVARNVEVPTRKFPILDSSFRRNPSRPRFVTWALLRPHEKRAVENHDQTLEQLASRGGLDWVEMYAIVMDKGWHEVSAMAEDEAAQRIIEMERAFLGGSAAIPVVDAAQVLEKATDG